MRAAPGLLALAACAAPVLPVCDPAAAPEYVAWVTDHGWHTELVVPVPQVSGELSVFASLFPGARALSFGYGKADFFTRAAAGSGDYSAGLLPGAGAVRVLGLPTLPGQDERPAVQVPLTAAEWAGLSGFLWRSFAVGEGGPVPVPAEPGVPGRFFAASAGYSLAYTCNTWTVDGLRQAGFEAGGPVVLAGGAWREAAVVRGACAPGR